MLTDMLTTMANGFVVSVTQDLVEVSCPCPARSRVQQLCTVRYKATHASILKFLQVTKLFYFPNLSIIDFSSSVFALADIRSAKYSFGSI